MPAARPVRCDSLVDPDLLALVAHELSQPLSSVASLADLVHTGWHQLTEDARYRAVATIDRSARRMVGLVQDMRLLALVDQTGGVTHGPVTAVHVVDLADTVLAALPAGSEVQVCLPEDSLALVDPGHLARVLTILLDNAIVHGAPPVVLAGTAHRDTLAITVTDRGAGLPSVVREELFEPATHAARGATVHRPGLGLQVARRLVQANGGALGYVPAQPRGAQFVVQLVRGGRSGGAYRSEAQDDRR